MNNTIVKNDMGTERTIEICTFANCLAFGRITIKKALFGSTGILRMDRRTFSWAINGFQKAFGATVVARNMLWFNFGSCMSQYWCCRYAIEEQKNHQGTQ